MESIGFMRFLKGGITYLDILNLDLAYKEADIIKFYLLYKDSNISELPNSFWNDDNGLYRAAVIVKYVIEEILKYNRKIEVIRNLSIYDLKNNKLQNMLKLLFQNDVYLAVNNAYPNMYKKCMFGGLRNYWDTELIIEEIERIALSLNKEAKDIKIEDINNSDFLGGERVFHRLYGGFDNFMDIYYPQEHWWIPRRTGRKRKKWSDEQEKEAITYVLVKKLGIDITDSNTYYHITVRDFYKEHMRFICDKYDYNVQKMVFKHYPKLKICSYQSSKYVIISPEGIEYSTNCLSLWIKEHRDYFPMSVKLKTIQTALSSISNPNNSYHSYHGWRTKRYIAETNS